MPDDYHALLSPSKAAMWIECANSLAASEGQPEGDKKAADFGTDKHEVLALCLTHTVAASTYIGHRCGKGHDVDAEFASQVQIVVDAVHERVATLEAAGALVTLEVEQDVPIEHITGEEGATGRADVVILADFVDYIDIEVWDAKFGYREVLPDNNPQGMMYAAGAIEKFSVIGEFRNATVAIAQPALSETPREWTFPVEVLNEWVLTIAEPAATKAFLIWKMRDERALKEVDFNPGEKQCEWCKAKAVCPAVKSQVEDAIGVSFQNMTEIEDKPVDVELLAPETLGELFPLIPQIEGWIKAVQARVEHELMQGREVPGCKVVEGRKGNRKWISDTEAEAMLKGFRLKEAQMYKFQLLGPKPILEALKDQPRRLKKIEALITQGDGKPHVTTADDPRPALKITPPDEGFDELC